MLIHLFSRAEDFHSWRSPDLRFRSKKIRDVRKRGWQLGEHQVEPLILLRGRPHWTECQLHSDQETDGDHRLRSGSVCLMQWDWQFRGSRLSSGLGKFCSPPVSDLIFTSTVHCTRGSFDCWAPSVHRASLSALITHPVNWSFIWVTTLFPSLQWLPTFLLLFPFKVPLSPLFS